MATNDVTLATQDGAMGVYEATPDGAARGAIVVVQEAFGVNEHIKDVTRRFAAEGYHAVAPAFFHRAGGGCIEDYDNMDFNEIIKLFTGLTDDTILADTDAALAHLHDAGFSDSQIGVVGFCFGGRVAFLVSLRRALGAGVTFYGGGIASPGALPAPTLIEDAAQLQTPWLGLFGDLDGMIPPDSVEALRIAVKDAKVDTEIVRYAEADHGFHCDARASYHEASAKDGWDRALAWFGTRLG
jgi:carboxymethylenebutenolidase